MKSMFRGHRPRLHFVGIGGIGMSGIAEILIGHGYVVSGSDITASEVTVRLEELGATIFTGHNASQIQNADVVVVSTAINRNNPEVQAAQAAQIPIVHRGEMLAELMRLRSGVAIAGSHGKTTTTSLIAHIFANAGLDPMAVVGGVVKNFGANAKHGLGDYLVAEADESDGSFLQLLPTIAVVTNIDAEHIEHYVHGFPELLSAFLTFINSIPFYGLAVLCSDHANVRALLGSVKKRYVTYGFADADYTLRQLETHHDSVSFVPVRRGEALERVTFHMLGEHNAQNALAALAVVDEVGIPFATYQKSLADFAGVTRRFEFKGSSDGITLYDDYGHHPVEMIATIKSAKQCFKKRLVVVFQPHRYSRTQLLLKDFANAFVDADVVILTAIYAAGEPPILGVDGKLIYDEVVKSGHQNVHYVENKNDIAKFLQQCTQAGDLVLTLGAGDINKIGEDFMKRLKNGAVL